LASSAYCAVILMFCFVAIARRLLYKLCMLCRGFEALRGNEICIVARQDLVDMEFQMKASGKPRNGGQVFAFLE